jgi:glyoxylase-like metal-dependent hydrolase (beta-lactamase superfamily II)
MPSSSEQIDYVLCTHLHVDHVGWNTRLVNGRWVPTFPNAKYLLAKAEWAYWEEHYRTEAFVDDPDYVDTLLPVIEAGLAEFVEGRTRSTRRSFSIRHRATRPATSAFTSARGDRSA